MRIAKVTVIFASIAMITGSVFAAEYRPYVGLGYKYQSMEGKNDWGKVLPKKYHNGRIYLGTMFHENFGVELGYSKSKNKTRDASLSANSAAFGDTVPAAAIITKIKVKVRSFDLDLNGYMPIANDFQGVGTIGFGLMKPKLDGSGTAQVAGTTIDDTVINATGRTKWVPRIGIGGEYSFGDISFRARILWENTQRLRIRAYESNDPTKAFKNSYSLDFGIAYMFL